MGIIYLASPYTNTDHNVSQARYMAVTQVAAQLVVQGKIVFSPITMTHPFDKIIAGAENTLGSDYWVKFDEAFMVACDELWILKLPGWDQSSGIKRETEFFTERGIEPIFLEPSDFDISKSNSDFRAAWNLPTR